ncbi:MAG: hypothetical protein KAJ19_29485 [Gammaproteobacteria bacterium]|nr:hypothetical protein [Gammaproteobacteria bacterium]
MVVINLVSNLDEDFDVDKFYSYNHTIAFSLRGALQELGHDVKMVKDHDIGSTTPLADHTVVISSVAMNKIRDDPLIGKILRAATKGKMALWLDAAFPHWEPLFDRILTGVPPYSSSGDHCRWVGYAADPALFYPEQDEKTVFVDSYAWGFHHGAHDWIFELIRDVLEDSGLNVIQPIETYNKGRVMWPEMQRALRASHFHLTTQIGHFGLTNIEATTCGAQLVIHKDLDRPTTWPFPMPFTIWETAEELEEILASWPNLHENRQMAMEHTWEKVALRVLEALND